jgi:hypothetical protein
MTALRDFPGDAREITVVIGMYNGYVEVVADADGSECSCGWDDADLEAHEREVHRRLVDVGFAPCGPWETSRNPEGAILAERCFTRYTASPPVRGRPSGIGWPALPHRRRELRGTGRVADSSDAYSRMSLLLWSLCVLLPAG